MSLEAALAANTAALTKLTEAWASLNAQARMISQKVDEGKAIAVNVVGVAEIPLAKVEAPKPVAAPLEQTAPVGSTATTTDTKSTTDEIPYDVVGKAITEGVKADRPKVLAALSKFGVKKGPELKPEQYADFLKELA